MFGEYLKKVMSGEHLTFDESEEAMDMIMGGMVDDIKLAAFLTALKINIESVDEIAGFAVSLRKNAVKFEKKEQCIDTCGTGGDGRSTINVSTIAAIIASCLGIKVAKHGNRAVSGTCGSADFIEALGINIIMSPEETAGQMSRTNFGFLFAPIYHKAMKNAVNVRKNLNTATVFNILGPLSNPACTDGQVMGVYKKELVGKAACVLHRTGLKKGFVVHGFDGSDEISVRGDTYVAELRDGAVREYVYSPKRIFYGDTSGTTPAENARTAIMLLENRIGGAKRELVLINSAAAICAAGKARDFEEGYDLARQVLEEKLGITKINEILAYQKQNRKGDIHRDS